MSSQATVTLKLNVHVILLTPTQDCKSLSFDFDTADSKSIWFGDLQYDIYRLTQIPPEHQRLFHKEKQVKSDDNLSVGAHNQITVKVLDISKGYFVVRDLFNQIRCVETQMSGTESITYHKY